MPPVAASLVGTSKVNYTTAMEHSGQAVTEENLQRKVSLLSSSYQGYKPEALSLTRQVTLKLYEYFLLYLLTL